MSVERPPSAATKPLTMCPPPEVEPPMRTSSSLAARFEESSTSRRYVDHGPPLTGSEPSRASDVSRIASFSVLAPGNVAPAFQDMVRPVPRCRTQAPRELPPSLRMSRCPCGSVMRAGRAMKLACGSP